YVRQVLKFLNSEAFGHFFVEEALAGNVRLDPFAINHKLRDRALTGMFYDFFRGPGRLFNVNFSEGNIVLLQEALGSAAVGTPEGGIDGDVHWTYSLTGNQYLIVE